MTTDELGKELDGLAAAIRSLEKIEARPPFYASETVVLRHLLSGDDSFWGWAGADASLRKRRERHGCSRPPEKPHGDHRRDRRLSEGPWEPRKVWRWDDFKRGEGIKVEKFKDAGAEVLYQRKSDGYGRILASNITPYGEIARRKDVDINLGEKLIDSLTADALNYNGVVAVPINYDGTFRKLKGLEEAFDHGLTESIEARARLPGRQ